MVNSLKNLKGLVLIAALIILLLVGLNCTSVYAGSIYNDNVSFSFTIKAYKGNGREGDARYRETRLGRDAWKVKMTSSSESKTGKTVSKFWLENKSGTNVSNPVEKKLGSGY